MLAFLLSLTGPDEVMASALERGVRFQLDHLVLTNSSQPFPYCPAVIDRQSPYDRGASWILWGGSLVMRYGISHLSKKTADELREFMGQTWSLISTDPVRSENPCHNQLLAFCEIGILYSRASGRNEITHQVLEYYHQHLRKLRVYDRGHWIYTEFNQWDANYGLLSWMALEHLFAATKDPAFAEDADEMALYFNELVSAGGYYWGGPRYNEGGLEEFIHLPASRAVEMGLDRLLIPAPADEWERLVLDGHYGRVLVLRMDAAVRTPAFARSIPATPWSFSHGNASVCLSNDFKLHHLSSAGLEIIPAIGQQGHGSGLTWCVGGVWKRDLLQLHPPAPSEGLAYGGSKPIKLQGTRGLTSFQRGYGWETRQWWLGTGKGLLWIGHLFSHSGCDCEKMDFVLGTPVLTRRSGQPVPVTEVESVEGEKADTQGDAATISSGKSLRFGDNFVVATAPLQFLRPAKDSFHTFPLKQIYPWDCASSNQIRLLLSEEPMFVDCRESLFFAVQIGRDQPVLASQGDKHFWSLKAQTGEFKATLLNRVWNYTFKTFAGQEELPQIGFGFNPEIR